MNTLLGNNNAAARLKTINNEFVIVGIGQLLSKWHLFVFDLAVKGDNRTNLYVITIKTLRHKLQQQIKLGEKNHR